VSHFFEYYIIAACFAMWVWLSIWGYRMTRANWREHRFPSIPGAITHLELVKEATISSEFQESKEQIVLETSYSFEIDGRRYQGSFTGAAWRFRDGGFTGEPGETPLYEGKRGVGDPITVYYDPEDPQINRGRRGHLDGVMLLLGAQAFLVTAIHLIRKWL